jgi:hypothetical protein
MSYLATGDTGYRLTSDGKCVNAMNQAADASLCAPSGGFLKTFYDALTAPKPIKASDIPVPTSKVAAVKFSGSTSPWAAVPALATKAAKTAEAAPSSGMPGWVLPVALGGGALVLVLALTRK